MWMASKSLVVSVRIPKDIGVLVIISEGWRTIISGPLKFTDALCLLLNMGGNLGNVTGNFTRAHRFTASVLGSILVLPHLLILCCREIPIPGIRILCLGYVSAGIDFRLGWEAAPPVTPAFSAPTTILASTASQKYFKATKNFLCSMPVFPVACCTYHLCISLPVIRVIYHMCIALPVVRGIHHIDISLPVVGGIYHIYRERAL